ncbi:hypothetical protein N7463_010710 [Penicillium fimorum]|uniref:HpcH/HpaI aldolase/citrate lyase domain-containing protein n=1 Tax=Penicillium fimorum TaxID=1882269 RepID=A0A9W9XKP3_9EURO|nr:hypothetical protein N7463_010710 [Penicillium fimorum]
MGSTSTSYTNNLLQKTTNGQICKAFGIRLVTNPQVVQLASNCGYDALFIDLEHSTLSLNDASLLCMASLGSGITPFVRVPYQCGDGFVQRVLDGGAMGVVFPHIHNKAVHDRPAAIFPTAADTGRCFHHRNNSNASSVFVMIETKESIDNVDDIAAVDGIDDLLIGLNDLATELGVPAQFKRKEFQSAVEAVSQACKEHGKVFGLAGIYENEELHDWALNKLGAGFILVQQDSGILARAGKDCSNAITALTGR